MLTATESCVVDSRATVELPQATFVVGNRQDSSGSDVLNRRDEGPASSSNRSASQTSVISKPHFISELPTGQVTTPSAISSQAESFRELKAGTAREQIGLRSWIQEQFVNRTNSDWIIETFREMVEPLTCIAAYAMAGEQFAKGQGKTVNVEVVADLFGRISSEAARLGGTTRTAIRNLRRRPTGSVLINLRDLVDEAFDFARPLMQQRGLKSHVSSSAETTVVVTNVNTLQAILQDILLTVIRGVNLAGNAPQVLQAAIYQRPTTAVIAIELSNLENHTNSTFSRDQTDDLAHALESHCSVWNIAFSSIRAQTEVRKPRPGQDSPSIHISIPMQGASS